MCEENLKIENYNEGKKNNNNNNYIDTKLT